MSPLALLLLLAAATGAALSQSDSDPCGDLDTIRLALDCLGSSCSATCKASLDAIKARGPACEQHVKDGPSMSEYDTWLQMCFNPTTDQCVDSSNSAFVDCMDVDLELKFCPEKCKSAIAATGMLSDGRCLELTKNYYETLDVDVDEVLRVCGLSAGGSGTSSGAASHTANLLLILAATHLAAMLLF